MNGELRLLVNGSKGRMGQTIIACASRDVTITISAAVDAGDDFLAAIEDCDAVVDFSHHAATQQIIDGCLAKRRTLVIGTTGHTDEELALIRHAAQALRIVMAPNYSVGVNALFWLARSATRILGEEFDLEVVEMHHRMKKDAPSGTAKRLAQIVAEVRELSYENDVRHGRSGMVGERTSREVGMHALRGGDVVGDHTVIFAGDGERIELTHKASSRETFALGAIRAAKWAAERPPGLYDMQDVLGLKQTAA